MDMSKYKWHGSEEELKKLMDGLQGKLVNTEDWKTIISEKEKYYDAEEFLKAAQHYYALSPPDLIQTSAKLWLACVYCVKDYYLQMGIHAESHRSLKFLLNLAIDECSNAKMARVLSESWIYAEQFHQYSYGSTNFNPRKFESRKAAVESFVHEFPTIDKSVVFKEALKLINCSNENIVLKSDAGKTSLGKKEYQFNYKAY